MNNKGIDNAFEALLEQAVKKSGESFGKSYPKPKPHEFSEKFNKDMDRFFKKQKNRLLIKKIKKYSQRAAVIILIFGVLSGIAVFSVQAWRVKFLNFIMEITHTDTTINFDENSKGDTFSNEDVTLGYVPEGFKLEKSESRGNGLFLVFTNNDKDFRLKINSVSGSLSIDTENADIQKLKINGMDALYSSNNNINIIVWQNDELTYSLSSNLDKDEIIRIVENVK